jgi:hypothetical protein
MFATAGRVFDGDVPIAVARAAWVVSVEQSPFLTSMNFIPQTDKKLFVHHSGENQHLSKTGMPGVQALAWEN